MGIESYGYIGFYISLMSIISILDLGISSVITMEFSKRDSSFDKGYTKRDVLKTFEVIYWLIAALTVLFFFVLSDRISIGWLKSDIMTLKDKSFAIRLMILSIAVRFPMNLYQGAIVGLQKHFLNNLLIIVVLSLRSIGSLCCLLIFQPTIITFFIWQVCVSIVEISLYNVISKFYFLNDEIVPRFKFLILKLRWRYAASVGLNGIVGVVLTQTDKLILSSALTLKHFAYYSVAVTFSGALWMLITPLNSILFPKIVRLYNRRYLGQLKNSLHYYTQLLNGILISSTAVLFFFNDYLLYLWLHDHELVANISVVSKLLLLSIMLNGLSSIPATFANSMEWPGLMLRTNLTQAIILIPFLFFMVTNYGIIGAGVSMIVMQSTYILFLVPIFFSRHLITEKKKWYVEDVLKPLVVAFSLTAIFSELGKSVHDNFVYFMVVTFFVVFFTIMALPKVRTVVLKFSKFYIHK